MYEVGVVAQFEAAHRLTGDFGPACRLHGHTYHLEVTVEGESLRADGTLIDVGVLQEAVSGVTSAMNFRDLDELERFKDRNSTAEAVARHVFDEVRPQLECRGLASMHVRVWESPVAFASFKGQVD